MIMMGSMKMNKRLLSSGERRVIAAVKSTLPYIIEILSKTTMKSILAVDLYRRT